MTTDSTIDDVTEDPNAKYVATNNSGKVVSRRFHLFPDCSTLRGEAEQPGPVTDREVLLLGLRVCSVCERRQTGGPAIEALKEIIKSGDFGHTLADESGDDPAWVLLNGLKERGFYIAQRRS